MCTSIEVAKLETNKLIRFSSSMVLSQILLKIGQQIGSNVQKFVPSHDLRLGYHHQ